MDSLAPTPPPGPFCTGELFGFREGRIAQEENSVEKEKKACNTLKNAFSGSVIEEEIFPDLETPTMAMKTNLPENYWKKCVRKRLINFQSNFLGHLSSLSLKVFLRKNLIDFQS